MKKQTILVIDDEASQRVILVGYLKQKGYDVLEASSGSEGIRKAHDNIIDIVLTDYKMPDKNGLEVLQEIRKNNPETSVVIITAFGTIEDAVKALKEGAYDYLTKPIDLDELDLLIKRISERQQLISENRMLKEQLSDRYKLSGIIAVSEKMEEVLSVASRVADSKATVLISGESGTGKELLAKAIHFASPRKNKAFVAVNCAALSENLLESELFGHEKGAFTGADKQRAGRFETADGGTIFLDEIGDLPLSTQVKLLRVLQEEKFERVGSSKTVSVDVRVIAATNRNIFQLTSAGKFREDLYYRLNVVSILIPPLRERKEDIKPLIEFYTQKYAHEAGNKKIQISREAMDSLLKFDYPGNVRELENIVHRAVVLSRGGFLTTDDIAVSVGTGVSEKEVSGSTAAMNLTEKVEQLEKKLVLEALQKAGGNQSHAARLLGISERNLRYRLNKWGMKE
jgi:two-component system NtrC family response regulator